MKNDCKAPVATPTRRSKKNLQPVPKNSKTGNVALKLPKCPSLRDILGDLRAIFLADLARKLFLTSFSFLGFVGHRGFTIVLEKYEKSDRPPFCVDFLFCPPSET